MSRTIIVTGANGQLGSCLKDIASNYSQYKFIFTDIAELDITDAAAVSSFFVKHSPSWVVNCAAYTAVDKAESSPEEAMLLNATAVGILAKASHNVGASILHISTDYIFDGTAISPITESAKPNPLSVYGRTKLEGEKAVVEANPHHIIIRTSWLYGPHGNNFVKTMMRLSGERSEIDVVADQWGCPTSAVDLAEAIITAIKSVDRRTTSDVYGIYNYSNEGAASWALFAEEVMMLIGSDCHINLITTEQYPTAACRPAYSILSKKKFTTTFGSIPPEWELSLEVVIERLNNPIQVI